MTFMQKVVSSLLFSVTFSVFSMNDEDPFNKCMQECKMGTIRCEELCKELIKLQQTMQQRSPSRTYVVVINPPEFGNTDVSGKKYPGETCGDPDCGHCYR